MSGITPPPAPASLIRQPCRCGGRCTAWNTRTLSTRPIRPAAISSRIARCAPAFRRWWLVAKTTPFAAAARTISAASAVVIASGFSQSTCLPAAIAAIACGWCFSLVVEM